MDADEIAIYVTEQYPVKVERRKVGLELEYPVVFADGRGVSYDVIDALFDELGHHGWRVGRDADTGARVTAELLDPGPLGVVTTEFGAHTLEIELAPADDVMTAGRSLETMMTILVPALRRHNAFIIGYGVQPLTPPVAENVAPRGRYRLLQKSWIESPQNLYDIFLLTLSASSQTHVDVARDEVIPAVNALNCTAGLRVALFANSSVWNGRPGDYAASREMFWDWCYAARKNQIGIPPLFSSVKDYVDYVLSFRALLTRHDGEVLRPDNRNTVAQYLANDVNSVETAQGQTVQLGPTMQDVSAQWGLAWFDARMQPSYGTVEDRCACQQQPSASLAPAALAVGLVENLGGLREIADSLPVEQWREIRELACKDGMEIDLDGVDVKALIRQLLDVAVSGLVSRRRGEEKFLEPLFERLRMGTHPAIDVERWFLEGGARSIVLNTDMGRFI